MQGLRHLIDEQLAARQSAARGDEHTNHESQEKEIKGSQLHLHRLLIVSVSHEHV